MHIPVVLVTNVFSRSDESLYETRVVKMHVSQHRVVMDYLLGWSLLLMVHWYDMIVNIVHDEVLWCRSLVLQALVCLSLLLESHLWVFTHYLKVSIKLNVRLMDQLIIGLTLFMCHLYKNSNIPKHIPVVMVLNRLPIFVLRSHLFDPLSQY